MKLSKQDADLYFELMWSLQFFVNRKLGLLPNVPAVSNYRKLPQEEKMKVREALYEKPEQIDEYVKENPDRFSAEKLEIVSKWKNFVRGDFYIERYLKKSLPISSAYNNHFHQTPRARPRFVRSLAWGVWFW